MDDSVGESVADQATSNTHAENEHAQDGVEFRRSEDSVGGSAADQATSNTSPKTPQIS